MSLFYIYIIVYDGNNFSFMHCRIIFVINQVSDIYFYKYVNSTNLKLDHRAPLIFKIQKKLLQFRKFHGIYWATRFLDMKNANFINS